MQPIFQFQQSKYYCWLSDCPRGPNGVAFSFRHARDEHVATAHLGSRRQDSKICSELLDMQHLLFDICSGKAFSGREGPSRLEYVLQVLPDLKRAMRCNEAQSSFKDEVPELRWPFNSENKDSSLVTPRHALHARHDRAHERPSRRERIAKAEHTISELTKERSELSALLKVIDCKLKEAKEIKEYNTWAIKEESESSKRIVKLRTAEQMKQQQRVLLDRLQDGLAKERARESALLESPLRESKATGPLVDLQIRSTRAKQGRLQNSLTRTQSLTSLLNE